MVFHALKYTYSKHRKYKHYWFYTIGFFAQCMRIIYDLAEKMNGFTVEILTFAIMRRNG